MPKYTCRKCGNTIEYSKAAANSQGMCSVCGGQFRFPAVFGANAYQAPTAVSQAATIPNGFAAILSFFFPGLGQACQSRFGAAAAFFFSSLVLYVIFLPLGLVPHLWSVISAARHSD